MRLLERRAVLGWMSNRLIMEQPDCVVGKLELLRAWWTAGLGCNQRDSGFCPLILLRQVGVGLLSTVSSASLTPQP